MEVHRQPEVSPDPPASPNTQGPGAPQRAEALPWDLKKPRAVALCGVAPKPAVAVSARHLWVGTKWVSTQKAKRRPWRTQVRSEPAAKGLIKGIQVSELFTIWESGEELWACDLPCF